MVVALMAIRIFASATYLCPMPKSPFEPCIPTRGTKVPDRPEWIHEVKHDGYRLIVQREGNRVRLFTRKRARLEQALSANRGSRAPQSEPVFRG